MLLRLARTSLILFVMLLFGPHALGREDEQATRPNVRVVYLVSNNRVENKRYTAAIEQAIRDLQKWYSKQLGGPTFLLHDPVVEIAKSNRPADWFSNNPNGEHRDTWGFNNTLDEAKLVAKAKQNDPNYVWVIYSDGPGNTGRGGNGVACLPEDDLLGLVGNHPTQKDKLRWIAGLGHELGHAFGLPHPTDTIRDADAIMWTGIYGKYPNITYLTDEDKKTLMRSPFFFAKDGTPVFRKGEVVATYNYDGGAFKQHAGKAPIFWTESKIGSDETFTFEESRRDARNIVLRDAGRGLMIRLPIRGGVSSLSMDNEKTWQPLYQVAAPSISNR